jgi:hypothetical protein
MASALVDDYFTIIRLFFIAMSSELNSFLDYANLNCVVHNGTCWAACIANSLGLGPNGIVQVVDLAIAMTDDPLLPPLVHQWICAFEEAFQNFIVAPPSRKYLPGSVYVTTPVLQAYANRYGIAFIMTTTPDRARGARKAVNVCDVITPRSQTDAFTTIVIRVEGQKFDYYSPKKGFEKQYHAFIEDTLQVQCTAVIPFLSCLTFLNLF